MTNIIGPDLDELKPGDIFKVVQDGQNALRLDKLEACQQKHKHVTTIAGPQAEAIIEMVKEQASWRWEDKSVPGLPIVEIWQDANEED